MSKNKATRGVEAARAMDRLQPLARSRFILRSFCPCCLRSLAGARLERHIARKHPEYAQWLRSRS